MLASGDGVGDIYGAALCAWLWRRVAKQPTWRDMVVRQRRRSIMSVDRGGGGISNMAAYVALAGVYVEAVALWRRWCMIDSR